MPSRIPTLSGELGRKNPCSVFAGGRAFRRRPDAASRPVSLVPPGACGSASGRNAAAAPFRRSRSGVPGLAERAAARRSHRRLHRVHAGRDGCACGKQCASGCRPRRDGYERAVARQAENEARRHLVHAAERHLADGLGGVGAGALYLRPADHPRRRAQLRARHRAVRI